MNAYKGMKVARLASPRSKHLETLTHTLLSTAHAIASGHNIVHYRCLGPALFSFLPRLFGKTSLTRMLAFLLHDENARAPPAFWLASVRGSFTCGMTLWIRSMNPIVLWFPKLSPSRNCSSEAPPHN